MVVLTVTVNIQDINQIVFLQQGLQATKFQSEFTVNLQYVLYYKIVLPKALIIN